MKCTLSCRLRDDLRVKQRQNESLEIETTTLKSSLATKERALAKNAAESEAARAKLLQTEGGSLYVRLAFLERRALQVPAPPPRLTPGTEPGDPSAGTLRTV